MTKPRNPKLKVGIVGGSVAGCAAAIELIRAGHNVMVFERSTRELVGRGAGIGTPIATLEALIDRDLIDADIPHFNVHRQPFISRSTPDDRLGHTAWASPITLALINWGDLYRNLRRRVPDTCYHAGRTAVGAKMISETTAMLKMDNGSEYAFDLIIFADGYRSLGRQILYPKVELNYCGYVLWRGVLEEKDLEDSDPLEGMLPRVNYKDLPGHVVMYFVPGHDGSVEKGERWVNWACYIPVTDEELPTFLIDRMGRKQTGSLPPGSMRPSEEDRLKALMRANLPTYYADIIDASQNTFAQPIFLAEMPGYFRDRICLFGDAGTLAQPFTGSGVFKGTNNAIDLVTALQGLGNVDLALTMWGKTQTTTGRRLAVLGRQMEKAFVWDAPDFSQMNEAEAKAWWQGAVTFPDEFSYEAQEDV